MSTANAIDRCLTSPNVLDQNLEPANVVDALNYIAIAITKSFHSLTPYEDGQRSYAIGGDGKAKMSMVDAVADVAKAINNLADAVRSHP